MKLPIIPVILAGGSGSRLWPLSRESYPKQFLNLIGQHSLLQETVLRVQQAVECADLLIVTNDDHYFLCLDQLNELNVEHAHFVLEPCARNTAPAIALAAQYIHEHLHKKSIMLVLPADHLIKDTTQFAQAIQSAVHMAQQQKLVIFGVQPTAPKTGYGYIQAGDVINEHCYAVQRFLEKPELHVAESFLAQGNYYWNSGMFAFQPETYLAQLQQHQPQMYEQVKKAYQASPPNKEFLRIDRDAFAACPSDSIDYAIMEKTAEAVMVPFNAAWNDLGCWTSIAEAGSLDENNNFIKGQVLTQNSKNCLINSENQLVAAIGLTDQIIVSTSDALLVADKKYSQEVKKIVNQLQAQKHAAAIEHKKVFRPWGHYESLAMGTHYQVKHLVVRPGAKLSLQLHYHRSEHWVVISGEAEVVNGEEILHLTANQSTYISKETKHRLSNIGTAPLHVIEVQLGFYLGEDDIVRFEDVYARKVQSHNEETIA